LQNVRPSTFASLAAPNLTGTCFFLTLMVIGAGWIILKRIKPE
jgi:hypothetical protein